MLACCLRWAFIDLSAGPFSWGPAVGGEGVRTELSLPNVEKTIGAVAGIFQNHKLSCLQSIDQHVWTILLRKYSSTVTYAVFSSIKTFLNCPS